MIVLGVVLLQLGLVARAYWSDHREFGFQMFSESSTWRADVVRVTTDGRRVPIEAAWTGGYRWPELVRVHRMAHPETRQHADGSVDSQLAFLSAALTWVASNTPRDTETEYLEADVTYWHNADAPRTVVLRSPRRAVP